jgi:membrane fusion protein, multidrug efflux system
VFVSLAPGSGLLLNEYIRASIVAASENALVVPREAVLPEEGRYVLYTVREGRAVKHIVSLGLQSDRLVQVLGEGLEENEPSVIVGNSELYEGMAVQVEPGQ